MGRMYARLISKAGWKFPTPDPFAQTNSPESTPVTDQNDTIEYGRNSKVTTICLWELTGFRKSD